MGFIFKKYADRSLKMYPSESRKLLYKQNKKKTTEKCDIFVSNNQISTRVTFSSWIIIQTKQHSTSFQSFKHLK